MVIRHNYTSRTEDRNMMSKYTNQVKKKEEISEQVTVHFRV